MNSKWEKFAKDDPMYYIDTSGGPGTAAEKGARFFRAGKRFSDQTVQRVQKLLPDYKYALEIGCGMGRITLPHAGYFDKVAAVDISATMLKELNTKAEKERIANIHTFLRHEDWDNRRISYAYSYLVFQHIANPLEIKTYISRIAGCLKKGGIAQLQFDTRPPDMLYRLRNGLPDMLLPKDQKKGIRRVRRDAADLRACFRGNDLEIAEEIGSDTALHHFILRKVS